ncbi:MAG: hypothetical protein ACJ0BT_02410 [Pseudohongiellaceae bacterium]
MDKNRSLIFFKAHLHIDKDEMDDHKVGCGLCIQLTLLVKKLYDKQNKPHLRFLWLQITQ